ncbi:MAG: HDOD domain-containing protein [Chthonomonas sp.]|nr:HDOD domain-containing protein [Chthonomonas sp.]
MSEQLITIEEIVSRTTDLPSIPAAALKVLQETESSTSTASSVAQILSTDQALSARILRLANSAYYGLSRRVGNLSEAVVVLGMRTVRNLAIVASSYPWMTKPVPGYELGTKELWLHSFGVAIGAQLAAKRANSPLEEQAFTSGLLCDIGKLALSVWFENKTDKMLQLAQAKRTSFIQVERMLLGYDHAEVGAHLAESWNFPKEIVNAIKYHHDPDACEDRTLLVDCVHFGDYITMLMGFGLGGDGMQYRFCESTLERLGIEPDDLDDVISEFVTQYEAYEKMFEELQAA